MSIKTILFDLDGTLLPMDQEDFVKAYFKGLTYKAALAGYEPEQFGKTIWQGTAAMMKNDGTKTNEETFWKVFSGVYGEEKAKADMWFFDEFYRNDFDKIKEVCGFNPKASKTVKAIKDNGFNVVLATNPLFPAVATECRIKWAGLVPDDFLLYTTYENSRFCKPNTEYYKEIMAKLGLLPQECLMVGNDVGEDMIAETLGMKVFLLTECLINKENIDISRYQHGDFDDLLEFLKELK